MKEILGGNLDQVMIELNINAKKTYEGSTHLDDKTQIWEISDEDFERLCNIPDEEWKDDWGWWRWSEGSILGVVNRRYNINHHYINAWDREDEQNRLGNREYTTLLEYFCCELGVSTANNICAVAIDLAKQNNMTIAQLFKRYQG